MKPVGVHLVHPLQTRCWKHAHIYIYIYIYVLGKLMTCRMCIRVSSCRYKPACTHTSMLSTHMHICLAPALATSEPVVKSVFYHRKKEPLNVHPELRPATPQLDHRYSA
jgi:hypothetical protein